MLPPALQYSGGFDPVLAFKPLKRCGVGFYLNNVNKGTLKNP